MDNCTFLVHHGIKGQKWGVRRYQNPDGTLTDAGRKRQAKSYQKVLRKADNDLQFTTMARANLRFDAETYERQSEKASLKASRSRNENRRARLLSKSEKKQQKANQRMAQDSLLAKYQDEKMREIEITLDKMKNEGYDYKIAKTNFNESPGPNSYKRAVGFIKVNGQKPLREVNWGGYYNASSGNLFTVRDKSKMSDSKIDRWSMKKTNQSYRPQKVTRVYY